MPPSLYVTAPVDAIEILAGLLTRRTDVVLIDGRSGSGKTSLARALQAATRARGNPARLIHLEQIYQGWDGLAGAADAVAEHLVRPFALGRPGRWDEFDWERERVLHRHIVQPDAPLIVEGVGALHATSAASARGRVWVTTSDITRRERAMARDGDNYRRQWDRWARQEEAYIAAHHPEHLADVIVDTTYHERSQ